MVSKILQLHPCVFSGDRRCNSPGNNLRYLRYTFLEHSINKIVAKPVTQLPECGNSNRREKHSFQKVLHDMEVRDFNIKQITTQRHVQIKKYRREQRPNIRNLTFDMFAKTVVKSCQKLLKRSRQQTF